jgi:pimeloyl-ACP methyl ester carboxylesterase
MRALEAFFKEKFDYKFAEFSIASFAKSVEKEALIIHDEYDRVAPIEAAKSIHQNLKHSTLKITEGAGHSLNKDDIHQEIIDFLKHQS